MPDNDLEKYVSQFKNSTTAKDARAASPGGDDSVARVVDDELLKLGWSDNARLSLLGDLGRENGWNRNVIFGGHSDPKNAAHNRGIISWQKERRVNLDNYLKNAGVYGRGDDDELRAMVRFMDDEMRRGYGNVHRAVRQPDIGTYDASEHLRSYIKYVPDAPYNSYDNEFRTLNNRKWAEKARSLGLGRSARGLENYVASFKTPNEIADSGQSGLDAYVSSFKTPQSAHSVIEPPPLNPDRREPQKFLQSPQIEQENKIESFPLVENTKDTNFIETGRGGLVQQKQTPQIKNPKKPTQHGENVSVRMLDDETIVPEEIAQQQPAPPMTAAEKLLSRGNAPLVDLRDVVSDLTKAREEALLRALVQSGVSPADASEEVRYQKEQNGSPLDKSDDELSELLQIEGDKGKGFLRVNLSPEMFRRIGERRAAYNKIDQEEAAKERIRQQILAETTEENKQNSVRKAASEAAGDPSNYNLLSPEQLESEVNRRLEQENAKSGGSFLNAEKLRDEARRMDSIEYGVNIANSGVQGVAEGFAAIPDMAAIAQTAVERGVLGRDTTAKDTLAGQTSQAMRDSFSKGFKVHSGLKDDIFVQLARTFGQAVPSLVMGGIGAGANLGVRGTQIFAGAFEGSQLASESYRTAIKNGATENQALVTALIAAPVGAAVGGLSERQIFSQLTGIKHLDDLTRGQFTPTFIQSLKENTARRGKDFAKGGGVEYLEESVQNTVSKLAAAGVYEKEPLTAEKVGRVVGESLKESLPAFVVGGAMKTAAGLVAPETATPRIEQPKGGIVTPGSTPATAPPPATEKPETLAAQHEAMQNPDSSRVAVLYTDEQTAPEKLKQNEQRIYVDGGVLVVNTDKVVDKFGVRNSKQLEQFISENGFEPLIGIVSPVADTSTGVAAITRDGSGTELASAIVDPSNPAAVERQFNEHAAQFPGKAASQELIDPQAVVEERRQSTTENQPAIKQPSNEIAEQASASEQIRDEKYDSQSNEPPDNLPEKVDNLSSSNEALKKSENLNTSPDQVKEIEKTKHEFSSTQVNLPKDESEKVLELGKKLIKDEDLAEDGREMNPHITAQFGIETNDAEAIRNALKDVAPFKVKLGKTSIFPAKEGADYDVVKLDVDSPELHEIRKLIAAAVPHTNTHPTFIPHATLGYVKAGLGEKYVGNSELEGTEITFDKIVFSDRNRNQIEIPLTGNSNPADEQAAEAPKRTEKQNEPIATKQNSATAQAHDAATSPTNDLPEPTKAQIEAGNYRKGHININGLQISVENPVGSQRKGVDRDGKKWSVTMRHHYGYIKRTVGADTENIDVFVKDDTPENFSGNVFIVDQIHPDSGKFDEHKVMIGFASEQEARESYAANYAEDWKGLKNISAVPIDEFKGWTRSEQNKPFAQATGNKSLSPDARNAADSQKTSKPAKAAQVVKTLSVSGRNVELVKRVFGKAKVRFDDGSERIVNQSEIAETEAAENDSDVRFARARMTDGRDMVLHTTKDVKLIRREKDALAEKNYPKSEVTNFVEKHYAPGNYQNLKGQDNVYLVMPSTSGRNTIPRELAKLLHKDFGGEIVQDFAIPLNTVEAKKKGGLGKITNPARYEITKDLSVYKDKNIVIVDDVLNTGDTVQGLRRELAKQGLKDTQIAAIGASGIYLTTPRTIERIAEKLANLNDLDYNKVHEEIKPVLENTFGQFSHYVESSIKGWSAKQVYENLRDAGKQILADGSDASEIQRFNRNARSASRAGVRPERVSGVSEVAAKENRQRRSLAESQITKETVERALNESGIGKLAPVRVVQSESDLPAKVQKRIADENAWGEIAGVFHGSDLYLVADNLGKAPDDITRTAAHEIVGHFGVRALVGENLNPILDQIAKDFAGDKKFREIAKNYDLDLSTPEGRREAAEEYVAHRAEDAAFRRSSLFGRVRALVRQMLHNLRQKFGFEPIKWTIEDIDALIQNAYRRLSKQAAQIVNGTSPTQPQKGGLRSPAPALSDATGARFRRKSLGDFLNENGESETAGDATKKTSKAGEKSLFDRTLDVVGIAKSLKSSLDLSAAGRQGMILGLTHPNIARKSFAQQLRSAKNEENYNNFVSDLMEHPDIAEAERGGLYLSSLVDDSDISNREEAFMSHLLGDDKVFESRAAETTRRAATWHIRTSERAYKTYLDSLRIETFSLFAREIQEYNEKHGIEADSETYQKQLEGIARFVNYATGRGDLGRFNYAAPILNATVFSARYWASRLQVMNPAFYATLPKGARKVAIKNFSGFVGGVGVLLALAKAAGASVEWDEPDDPNALKIKLGNYSYDVSGGTVSHLRYLTRTAFALKEKDAGNKMWYLATRYGRSKLAPVPAAVVNSLTGTNFIGEPTDWKQEAKSLPSPIALESFYEAARSDGGLGIIKTIPDFFGIGTTRYKTQADLKKNVDAERARLSTTKDKLEREKILRRIKAWNKLLSNTRKNEKKEK